MKAATTAVATLPAPLILLSQVADAEYNSAQLQALFNKVDELIMALRRA